MEALIQIARYVRDTMQVDESIIKFGRQNTNKLDFDSELIVIDALVSNHDYGTTSFDGTAESMTYVDHYTAPITFNFYGSTAYSNAKKFIALTKSQRAKDAQRAYGVNVKRPSAITDVKQLTGAQYKARYEVQAIVEFNDVFTDETLRIDTIGLELRNEDGVFANIETTR